jgi:hypothetical protein
MDLSQWIPQLHLEAAPGQLGGGVQTIAAVVAGTG